MNNFQLFSKLLIYVFINSYSTSCASIPFYFGYYLVVVPIFTGCLLVRVRGEKVSWGNGIIPATNVVTGIILVIF